MGHSALTVSLKEETASDRERERQQWRNIMRGRDNERNILLEVEWEGAQGVGGGGGADKTRQ